MFKNLSDQYKGSLLAFIGVMFITPDSLFIRLSDIGTWGLLFYRGAIPFLVVLMGLIIFIKKIIKKVTLITPNIPEAEVLSGINIKTVNDMIYAAKKINIFRG